MSLKMLEASEVKPEIRFLSRKFWRCGMRSDSMGILKIDGCGLRRRRSRCSRCSRCRHNRLVADTYCRSPLALDFQPRSGISYVDFFQASNGDFGKYSSHKGVLQLTSGTARCLICLFVCLFDVARLDGCYENSSSHTVECFVPCLEVHAEIGNIQKSD